MFKKAMAGVLSAVLCASALLSGGVPGSRQTAMPPESAPASGQDPSGEELKGSNSLARYLAAQSSENRQQSQQMVASAAEPRFTVTNLEFDSETGRIRAVSSQSENCTLIVSFIDQDHPSNIYQVEFRADAGEFIVNEGMADLSRLPEYYTVSAQLRNRIGLAVCEAFTLQTHTREVCAFAETEATDFEPEQVVNFDEDDSTNFLVLTEDTVKAETSEASNVLVSADYDQNVYVFDRIDDSIRSLEKGQFFYIQPTEKDIIAICVQDVTVDGDTATLTGDNQADIGEMFDFIKVETLSESVQYTESSDPEMIEQVYGKEYEAVNVRPDGKIKDAFNFVSGAREAELDAMVDAMEVKPITYTPKLEGTVFEKKPVKVTAAFSIPITAKFNFYKALSDVHVYFEMEFKIEATIKASVSTEFSDGTSYAINPNDTVFPSLPPMLEQDEPTPGTHLFHVDIPTGVAGLFVEFNVDLKIKLNMELTFGWSKTYKRGFAYDSGKGVSPISEDSELKLSDKNSIQGSVSITLEISIGLNFARLVTAKAALAGTITVTAAYEPMKKKMNMDGELNSGSVVFMPTTDTLDEAIHACDRGISLKIDASISASITLGVGFKIPSSDAFGVFTAALNKLYFEVKKDLFNITFHVGDFHMGINKAGPYKGITLQKSPCSNLAYRTTFVLTGTNFPSGTHGILQVDSDPYLMPVEVGSKLVFYATPGEHTYTFTLNPGQSDQQRVAKSYRITDKPNVIKIPIDFPSPDDVNPRIRMEDPTQEFGDSYVPPEVEPVAQPDIPKLEAAAPSSALINCEYVQLGDSIYGVISNNRILSVSGCGDMYDFDRCPFSKIGEVSMIVMEDADPERDLVIRHIGAHVFDGAKNVDLVYMTPYITSIGSNAFKGCEALEFLRYGGEKDKSETFILPSGLTAIGDHAFDGCKAAAMGELKVPKTVSSIGISAFNGCLGLTSVDVPGDSEATVAAQAFSGCTNLKKAVLNKGVKQVGTCVFQSCTSLEDLTLPFFEIDKSREPLRLCNLFNEHGGPEGMYCVFDYWPSISYHIPYYAPTSLKHVTVLTGKSVPGDFFNNFKYVETITLCGEITEIGDSAFADCGNLKELYCGFKNISNQKTAIPQDLTVINSNVFSGCTNLRFGELTIPASVTAIKNNAFSGCCGITSLYIPGKTDTEEAPAMTVGNYAFSGCLSMKKVQLGDGVKSIGSRVFDCCIALSELMIPRFDLSCEICEWFSETNASYPDNMYMAYSNSGMYRTYCAAVPNTLNKIIVTGGTEIPRSYFHYLRSVTSIECRGDIEVINQDAFYGCSGLEMIRFGAYGSPDHIMLPETLTKIDNSAFCGCAKAKFGDLVIPESLVSIGQSAFTGCDGITALIVPGSGTTTLGGSAFSECMNLKKAVLWAGVKSAGGSIFKNCLSMEELVIERYDLFGALYGFFNSSNDYPDDLYLAYSSTNMFGHTTTAYAPKSLKKAAVANGGDIEASKFSGMQSIETLIIPVVPESVDNYAFASCTGLTELDLIGEKGDWNDVRIGGYGNEILLEKLGEDRSGGSYTPLVILAQPQDAKVYTGTKTDFYCMAAGKYELHYCWQYSDDDGSTWKDAGSTEYKLTVAAEKAVNGRKYRCIVEDEKQNRETSDDVTLTVQDDSSGTKPAGYHPGDLNGDGSIDVSDAVLLARFVAEDATAEISTIGLLNADVDGNGNPGMEDVILILKYIARCIRVFPVDEQ